MIRGVLVDPQPAGYTHRFVAVLAKGGWDTPLNDTHIKS
jgi:hypothetical protein